MTTSTFRAPATSVLTLLVVCSAPLMAADRTGAFAGGGIGGGSANLSNLGESFTSFGTDEEVLILEGHGGYRFSPYFALEGKLLGAANDSNEFGDEVSFGALSARAVGLIPVSRVVDLYGVLGAYSGSSEAGFSGSDDESGLVYGGGVQLNFGRKGSFGVRLEYEVYATDELLDDLQGFTAAFQYNFF
jgi:hypothetical protein